MPLYEYICQDCGKHFDTLRSMKDADNPIQCAHCDSQNTHRRSVSAFFAKSDGRTVAGSGHSCGGCSGGNCSGCGH